MADAPTKEDLEKIFAEKKAILIAELEGWFETETASIDGSIEAKAPAGAGGSIISVRAAIDSKRVVDATLITEEVLGIELPPEIIKPGGYDSCDAMIADLVPKLRAVFVGELKVKKTSSKQPAGA
ncbi:hypothetical protein [Phenylobacterium sp.]|uniref:hypothetical protein n=1 Tax=Phenylobacterium sp. TaxID=1871053 RepID=UPI00273310DF|nr:hypothetical protein [Phenylobacterium sp.]MDP3172956.1 hypothetical protein [Phenylobacterium sp.]MDP3660945.1 hypothetical protein [Phenylobacterium sp.]